MQQISPVVLLFGSYCFLRSVITHLTERDHIPVLNVSILNIAFRQGK